MPRRSNRAASLSRYCRRVRRCPDTDALLAFHARLLVEAFEQRPCLVARQEIAMDTVAEGIEIALSPINIVRGLGKIVA